MPRNFLEDFLAALREQLLDAEFLRAKLLLHQAKELRKGNQVKLAPKAVSGFVEMLLVKIGPDGAIKIDPAQVEAGEGKTKMLAGHGFLQGNMAGHQGKTAMFLLAFVLHFVKISPRLTLFIDMVDQ